MKFVLDLTQEEKEFVYLALLFTAHDYYSGDVHSDTIVRDLHNEDLDSVVVSDIQLHHILNGLRARIEHEEKAGDFSRATSLQRARDVIIKQTRSQFKRLG